MPLIDKKLSELNITLPEPVAPVATYVPYAITGNLVFISGQISFSGGALIKGRLGNTLTVAEGQEAARACGLNLLAQLKTACSGDLDRVRRVVKLGAFVCCAPDFVDQPKVANGCSDLMVAVFGEIGRHARAAVGANALPLGAAVEIDGVFEIA